MKIINTACPRNCYSSCSFKVVVEDDRIKSLVNQPLNLSTPEGVCIKGQSYIERTYSKDRILYPLQKINGKFVRIEWEQALQVIANKLKFFKESYGPHTVLFYTGSGSAGTLNEVSSSFWKIYGGASTVYGNLCWPAGLEATRLCLGSNKHNNPEDLENAKLIILWGKNPVETNIHQSVFLDRAKSKGAKLVVIDPRRTPTAEKADLLIQPKPGSDALMALYIAKLLIQNKKTDDDFIENHVLGYDEFKASLSEINGQKVETECGVSLPLIEKLATWIASIHPMTIIPGYGMQRYTNGGQTIRSILALSVITGNIGKKGASWQYANLQSYVLDRIKEPLTYFPDKKRDHPFRRKISTARLGKDMQKLSDPPLKMAWIERGNPLTQNPNSLEIQKAFSDLEFVVVVDQFMTDSALEADIILPAKTMFEQSDIIGSYWNPYVQLKQKVIDPPGEVKPETEIYWELAQLMGFDEEEIRKNIPKPGDDSIDEWLDQKLSDFKELNLESLKKAPVLAPGLENIAFANKVFPTPSGKIELHSKQAKELWNMPFLPSYESLKENELRDKYPLFLLSPNSKNRIHSQFGNLPSIQKLHGKAKLVMHPKDAIARSINEGDIVSIFNDRGKLEISVAFNSGLRSGCVQLYNGYWTQEGANPNVLSKGRETDMGYGAAFHDNRVEVKKTNPL